MPNAELCTLPGRFMYLYFQAAHLYYALTFVVFACAPYNLSNRYSSSHKGVALTVMPSKEVKLEIIHSELSHMCSVGILSCCLGNRPPAICWYDIPPLCLFLGDFYLAHQWMRFRSTGGGV